MSLTSESSVTLETLEEWLNYLEQCHPSNIELGLDRVGEVAGKLAIDFPGTRIISVGGTNGKGSTVAMLCAVLEAAGFTTASYTSPHLLHYNERVRLGDRLATDEELCASFAAVEKAREDIQLTYFEFGTLAAFQLIAEQQPDYAVLEIGLGGRLDAVNILEPDIAIVTNVALDHTDWLGDTREAIGYEKAGIFRQGKPALVGERAIPHTVLDQAAAVGAELFHNGPDFRARQKGTTWDWEGQNAQGENVVIAELPVNDFPLDNCATVLQAIQLAEPGIEKSFIVKGFRTATLTGRFQVEDRGYPLILDVAHNPHAAKRVHDQLKMRFPDYKLLVVVAMLADKNYAEVLDVFAEIKPTWFVAGIQEERGLEAKILYNYLSETDAGNAASFTTIREAFTAAEDSAKALQQTGHKTAILVTGSFFTVAAVLELL